jgi:hypothetical protein
MQNEQFADLQPSETMEPGAQQDVRLTDQLQVTLARSLVHLRHPHHVPELFYFLYFSVLRIRIHQIHMFLGLPDPDPDPLVRGIDPDPALDLDPDPSIIMQK